MPEPKVGVGRGQKSPATANSAVRLKICPGTVSMEATINLSTFSTVMITTFQVTATNRRGLKSSTLPCS